MRGPAAVLALVLGAVFAGCGPAEVIEGEHLMRKVADLGAEWQALRLAVESEARRGRDARAADLQRICRRVRAWQDRFERVNREVEALVADALPALLAEHLENVRGMRAAAAAVEREACAP